MGEQIGQGGYAKVFKGLHKASGQKVALKVIDKKIASQW